MRRLIPTTVTVAAVLVALAAPAAGQVPIVPGQSYVFCMRLAITSPLVKPRTCNTSGFPGRANSLYLYRLRWSTWGGPRARATGYSRLRVNEHNPTRVVLSRREDCRRRLSIPNWVYTRLTVTVYDASVGRYTMQMRTPGNCESLIQD